MEQTDESASQNVESPLKRKAISEYRLQDPKIWRKISWIRTNFLKDLNSGVRKTDFYNFVTARLGKTGYRDVWHLLKIAYPHVDRVRRGRMYMYWGIRHARGKVKFEQKVESDERIKGVQQNERSPTEMKENLFDKGNKNTNSDNSLEMDVEETVAEDTVSEDGEFKMEAVSESILMPSSQRKEEDEVSGKSLLQSEVNRPESSVVVKIENRSPSTPDEDKVDDFVVMEFKEKEVFASFEDYEKSKQIDQDENTEANMKAIGVARRSVSPPLQIFSSNCFQNNEKENKILDISKAPEDLHGNVETKGSHKEHRLSSNQDGFHGNVDSTNDAPILGEKDDERSPSNSEWTMMKDSTPGQGHPEQFVPNLLRAENINRVCMPLIGDLGKKLPSKSKHSNTQNELSSGDTQIHEQLISNIKDSATTPRVSVEQHSKLANKQFSCDPFIVSVTSIAELQDDKLLNKPNCKEVNDVISSKSVTAHAQLETNTENVVSSPSQLQPSTEDDTEFVVVQDRGIQVSEHLHNCKQLGKRGLREDKSTICYKPHHFSRNEPLKKLSSPEPKVTICHTNCLKSNSTSVSKERELNKTPNSSYGVRDDALVRHSRASSSTAGITKRKSPPIGLNRPAQRIAVTVPRNSSSAPNILNGSERNSQLQSTNAMKALKSNGPSYHQMNSHPLDGNRIAVSQLQTASQRSTNMSSSINENQVQNKGSLLPRTSPQTHWNVSTNSSSEKIYDMTSSEPQPIATRQLQHGNKNHLNNISIVNTFSTSKFNADNERNNSEQYSRDQISLRNRELIRKMLTEHEANSNPTCTSTSDLQVTVDCLSSELEKERTLRLHLEIELRKVEKQLNEERKMNERLASLLMKRY